MFSLTACQWKTVAVRHNFFEERFNLEQVYNLTYGEAWEDKGYFDIKLKKTYIQMHVPASTNSEDAPLYGDFEFYYQRTGKPLIESRGYYFGTGTPHSDTGIYTYTVDESTSERMIGTFQLSLVEYFRLQYISEQFVLDDGTIVRMQLTFRSAHWGG